MNRLNALFKRALLQAPQSPNSLFGLLNVLLRARVVRLKGQDSFQLTNRSLVIIPRVKVDAVIKVCLYQIIELFLCPLQLDQSA